MIINSNVFCYFDDIGACMGLCPPIQNFNIPPPPPNLDI